MALRSGQLSLGDSFEAPDDPDTPESRQYRANRLLRLAGEYRSVVGICSLLDIAIDFFEGGIATRAEAIALAGTNRRTFSKSIMARRAMFKQKRRASDRE